MLYLTSGQHGNSIFKIIISPLYQLMRPLVKKEHLLFGFCFVLFGLISPHHSNHFTRIMLVLPSKRGQDQNVSG
jgi:hypothetical protein